jgi:hypothetical protein
MKTALAAWAGAPWHGVEVDPAAGIADGSYIARL